MTRPPDMPMGEALAAATRLGAEHGKAAASWAFDGNTTPATYARAVRGLEDLDPEVLDSFKTPTLGGEYGARELCDDIGVDYDRTPASEVGQIADAYLAAADAAFWPEVERAARYQAGDTR